MNYKILCLLLLWIILIFYYFNSKRENFTQGYNYLIPECIRHCQLTVNDRNPYYSQYEDDNFFSLDYCEQKCINEYNKKKSCPSEYPIRDPTYCEKPLQTCSYFECNPNHDLFLK